MLCAPVAFRAAAEGHGVAVAARGSWWHSSPVVHHRLTALRSKQPDEVPAVRELCTGAAAHAALLAAEDALVVVVAARRRGDQVTLAGTEVCDDQALARFSALLIEAAHQSRSGFAVEAVRHPDEAPLGTIAMIGPCGAAADAVATQLAGNSERPTTAVTYDDDSVLVEVLGSTEQLAAGNVIGAGRVAALSTSAECVCMRKEHLVGFRRDGLLVARRHGRYGPS